MATEGWTVTGQISDVPVNTDAGRTVVGVQVYFITADGNEGSVFIPNNQYNAAHVRTQIHKQATALDEVGRLAVGKLAAAG